jgi:hypothetical protein
MIKQSLNLIPYGFFKKMRFQDVGYNGAGIQTMNELSVPSLLFIGEDKLQSPFCPSVDKSSDTNCFVVV